MNYRILRALKNNNGLLESGLEFPIFNGPDNRFYTHPTPASYLNDDYALKIGGETELMGWGTHDGSAHYVTACGLDCVVNDKELKRLGLINS